MARYVLFSNLTPAGRRRLHDDPDRIDLVNEEIAKFGCTVIEQFALLGPYDFITIIEAPDNETLAHLVVDLGSRGTVRIVALPALGTQEFRARLRSEDQLGRPLAGPIHSTRPV